MKVYLIIFLLVTFFLTSAFAQLESIGPEGGSIHCLVADNQENILAGIRFGGIYKTTNFGEEWTQIFYGYRNLDVRSLAVNSSNHYFAGTDETGLFRSTDQGATWEKLNNITAVRTIQVLLITPNGDIYAGTFDGIYKSTDNGNTFISSSNGITTSSISSLAFASDYLFAGTYYAGIFRSADGGESWSPINTGLDFNGRIVESIAFFEENSFVNKGTTTNYLAIILGSTVYESNNFGSTWTSGIQPTENIRKITLTPVNNETGIACIVITSSGGNTGGVITRPLNNQNAPWTEEEIPKIGFNDWVETSDGRMFASSSARGVGTSTHDFNTFNYRNNDLTATSISAGKVINEKLIIGLETGEVLTSNNYGTTWNDITYNLPRRYINDVAVNPVTEIIYAVDQYDTYRFNETESEWTILGVLSEKLDFNDEGIGFSGYGANVNISNDDFQTHTTVFTGAPGVNGIAFEENTAYLAASNQSNTQGAVYRSVDPYTIWSIDGLSGLPVTCVFSVDNSLSVNCLTDINLTVGTDDGEVFFRNNLGQYTPHSDGLANSRITSILSILDLNNPNDPKIILTQPHIQNPGDPFFTSSDFNCSSNEWFNGPILTADVVNYTVFAGRIITPLNENRKSNSQELYVYYGTKGTGVLRRDLLTDVKNISSELPEDYFLAQNYPNPFNPSTTIQFSIPEQSFVKLEVFNTLGEKVTTLVSEELNTGSYKFNWDAENLPSGVYLYKMQTTKFSTSRKMILIK